MMNLLIENGKGNLPDYEVQGVRKVNFNPYSDNGGSVVALAGDDFCVIAADTRLSTGFTIHTRNQDKLFPLSDTTILGCSGCWCDTTTLTRLLSARMQMYKHEHQKEMSTPAAAQMLSIMLYHKRFFPYYIGYKNQEGVTPVPLTQEKAIAILKDVFTSAAERDIYTGDGITIKIITKDGIEISSFALRKD
ncbi:Proteasome subunit beta type-1 [Trachymyrmex septentrionalis]|uniref:Proteasome subunit beta type-1 n=1 Tax=Trachymyrmex septentrionalis TaxID=34720 RepID=A0A195F7I7_9HYME|nr:Proteasome subunit beta type-1 [Trachymyrmex septentrionalis]